jgi:hypothetical protein
MQDPFITIGRILMLVFPPFMILVPLVTALLVPRRATGGFSSRSSQARCSRSQRGARLSS